MLQRSYFNLTFGSDFATSRAASMKSCVTGLIISTGLGKTGSLTGKTLIERCFAPNRNVVAGHIVNKPPLASIMVFNWVELETRFARGIGRPHAANVSV
jgi:hypothetical protein